MKSMDSKLMPWQVKTIFGAPLTAIAVFLVYQLASGHATAVTDTNSLIKMHIETSVKAETMHQEHERALERILRAICVNGTTTSVGRQNCLQ